MCGDNVETIEAQYEEAKVVEPPMDVDKALLANRNTDEELGSEEEGVNIVKPLFR